VVKRARPKTTRMICAWCSARWSDGAELEVIGRTIQCMRGHGCARRPDAHERTRDGHREYLLDGYWYRQSVLSKMAGVDPRLVSDRLRKGWPVRDAMLPSLGKVGPTRRRRRVAIVAVLTTPGSVVDPESMASRARALGISAASFYERVYRYGLQAAINMGGPRRRTDGRGRPPIAGKSQETMARAVGLTRGGLWKAAKRSGRTIADEAASRAKTEDGKW